MTPGFWILPTLRRPQNMARLIASYRDVEESAPVVVYLWRHDPAFFEYLHLPWPEEWDRVIEAEEFTAAGAMRMAFEGAPNAEFYGFLADDVIFHTKWSERLAEAAVPHFVAWPDDYLQGPRMPTHFVCGGELVRAIGWWAVPDIEHYGLDVAWKAIGAKCSGLLRYCPEVKWEHVHYFKDAQRKDAIYEKAEKLAKQDDINWRKGRVPEYLSKATEQVRELLWR